MRPFRFIVFPLLFSLSFTCLYAQQKSRVAVLPFTAVEVSPSEAKVLTSLFETALVKTGVYNIIEQNQIADILKIQAFSLSGCTDDACAVEVGKLLATELIVLGEISRVGGQYIATAKLIDVGLGRNVNADSVTAATITEMTNQAITLLAYKLAGLTYSSGGGERIAEALGEIYVSTTPDGAEIFINGIRRGTSPILVDKVPLGTARVMARYNNLSGEALVEISGAELLEVEIQLKVSMGRLFIKSSEKEVDVFLDGKSLGPLGGGLFKDLPSGEHTLTLKGNGVFWEERVIIEADKSVSVEAYPTPFGTLKYNLPDGVVCEISGDAGQMETRLIAGSGTLDLVIGSYSFTISGEYYLSLSDTVTIEQGITVVFNPRLEYTDAQRVVVEHEKIQKAFRQMIVSLSARIDQSTSRLGEIKNGNKPVSNIYEEIGGEVSLSNRIQNELGDARSLYSRIMPYGNDFPDLLVQAAELTTVAITNRIVELEALTRYAKARAAKRGAGQWVSIGVGAAGFILSGVFYYLGTEEYATYLAAQTTTASEASHAQLNSYAMFQTGGFIAGVVGTLLGLILSGKPNGTADYAAEITKLSAEREALGGGAK